MGPRLDILFEGTKHGDKWRLVVEWLDDDVDVRGEWWTSDGWATDPTTHITMSYRSARAFAAYLHDLENA